MTSLRFLVFLPFVFLLCITLAAPAVAVNPSEILDDPKLEERARDLSTNLRCLVCQNQSIDDSDAPLARDLRVLVRERLVAGDSNDEVIDFVVARYGEFVLMTPRFAGHTVVLWLAAPVLLLVAGGGLLLLALRRRGVKPAKPKELDADEKQKLARLLSEEAKV